jgi:hypothetical protein
VKESWPERRNAISPLPARGLGTLPSLALQWPLRLRPRSSWPQLQGRVRWTYSIPEHLHARPFGLSVASPPQVPPVGALHHWRTRRLRQVDRRGAKEARPHRLSPLRRAE